VPQGSVLRPLLFSIFITPVSQLLLPSMYHTTCRLMIRNSTHQLTLRRRQTSPECHYMLRQSPSGILSTACCSYPTKIEVLLTCICQQVTKFNNITADSPAFQFAGTSFLSRILFVFLHGAIADQHLTVDTHVSKIVFSYNYHIRGLRPFGS